jgi:glycogen debranching enzyme
MTPFRQFSPVSSLNAAPADPKASGMSELTHVHDPCELTTSSHPSTSGTQVLKQGDTFAVLDRRGEAGVAGETELGLYHRGTRHLSQWQLMIGECRPMLLNSTMKEDNSLLIVQMTTPDLSLRQDGVVPHGTLHAFRSLIVQESAFYEHLELTNYSRQPIELFIKYIFGADFRDVFEVRGARRERRGDMLDAEIAETTVILGYRGLDDQQRRTAIEFDGQVEEITQTHCLMRLRLNVGAEAAIHASVSCTSGNGSFRTRSHAEAVEGTAARIRQDEDNRTEVFTSNERFNEWINRSVADLQMLVTETMYGSYPYAGVPWFTTPFGRDGLITALEVLSVRPQMAKGVLSFLAATQASERDESTEAEPGKIIHEMRDGEMAALGEIPFRRYYGTVDSTPLFVVLAGRYFHRTGDIEFIRYIWNNIRRAIDWIDEYGDADGDGFVEYATHNQQGLVHQCWKDSNDSIFHADGRDASPPIAVSEVQGYVYEAKLLAAELAELLGEPSFAARLRSDAAELKQRFNEHFWVSSIETFAIALDGDHRPCAVRNSNAGHLLYSGIVGEQYVARVAATLTDSRAFNGWGIRTISEGETRFNPMSYHNGSVWPHDSAIAVAGLSRYGFCDEAEMVMGGLFSASLFNELHRLPELFCGFERLPGHGPTLYPVACSPQAWAAGSVFLVLQSILGLSFSPTKPQVRFDNPRLPDFLDWVRIQNLRVGDGSVDLALRRHPRDVGLNVERKEGDIQIVVLG